MDFERSPFTIPAAILGGSLVVATVLGSFAAARIKASADVISVTGSAQRAITSDVAVWRLSLSRPADAAGMRDASAQLERDLASLRSYLKKSGVPEASVTVQPVSVEPQYNANGPSTYNIRQDVRVEGSDVPKLTSVAQGATSLLTGGSSLSTTALEYYYSKLGDLKVAMLAEATADAQTRAQRIAESAGSRLGKLKSASQGVFQITPVNSTDVSDYGTYDTSTVQKQITAVVRTSFTVR